MSFYENAATFAGKRVVDFQLGGALSDPAKTAPRVRVEYDNDHTAVDLLSQVLEQPQADQITALVVGAWVGEMYETDPSAVVEALVASAAQLPQLNALFIGDITMEENEISWIVQSDMSPILTTFDRLETLHIRGSQGLSLGSGITHDHLKTLIIECGGLPASVLREIASATFPALEHLELYLGTDNYGWDGSIDDLQPLLSGELFPKLTYLGLRDSEIADEVAAAVAAAPIVERIKVLDLSLGTLTDAGAQALLESPLVAKLEKLDLHHHFCSDEMAQRLSALPPEVDVSDKQAEEDDYRYVAVSE